MSAAFGFGTPFAEQLAFFREKLRLPSEHWDDIQREAHDRAFIVAGAMKADLLDDLQQAVFSRMADGGGLEAFRKDFRRIVGQHGWQGWTGEGSPGGFAWRTQVIYQTNMATSYAAGRYQQLTDPEYLTLRPYWRYKHADGVMNPRLQHVAWNGLTLPHDHPFWQTHFAPNGWGCHCRIIAVNAREYAKSQAAGLTEPPAGWDVRDDKGNLPGIARGFDYAPGASVAPLLRASAGKLDQYPRALARMCSDELRGSELFRRFVNGQVEGDFPLAVLDEATQAALGSQSSVVLLSQETAADHVTRHPEIGVDDYRKIQAMLDQGEIYKKGAERLIYLWSDDKLYRAALKRTRDGQKNYFLTLFHTSSGKAAREVVSKMERIR